MLKFCALQWYVVWKFTEVLISWDCKRESCMKKNNIKPKEIRALTQEELNHISGGFWNILIPVAAALIGFVAESVTHRIDKDKARREGIGN